MKIPRTQFKVVILALFLLPQIAISQSESDLRKLFVEAESFFLFEEYNDALPLYQRIIRDEPENYNVKYKIGICYLNDPYQKEKSVKFLVEAAAHINKEFKKNTFKEKMAPPEANFYLGQAYRINGNLNKALEYFSLFKKDLDPAVFDINVVNEEINSCLAAKKLVESPVYRTSANIGDAINSRFAELNPIVSSDGKTMVFTRSMQFYDGVFLSKRDKNGNWSPPYNLTPDFGLDGNSYCTGISADGTEIFVYRSDNYDGNIYSSKFVNNKWQKLVKLNEFINTKYWESHASPSPDGKYLYFTSNRKGGYGGLDIYRAPLVSGNTWGEPVNLGPVVNSPYNEETPFVTADNNLFFSSLGHNSMGGYDIYVTQQIAPGTWAKPVNMGFPVNTTDDDLFFSPVNGDEYTAVYATYDAGTTLGLKDIYWVKAYNSFLPRSFTVKGQVNAPTAAMLTNGDIKVSLIDNKAGKIVEQTTIDENGNFVLVAPQGNYQLLVDGKGIKPYTEPIELSLTQPNETVILPLILTQTATAGEDVLMVMPTPAPRLDVVGQDYIVTQTSPVSINLKVEKGSDLVVQTFVNGELKNTEAYHIAKEKFNYEFTPSPGENKVVFTITDNKGNVNTKEVIVIYNPEQEIVPVAKVEQPVSSPTAASEVALISAPALKLYLESLDKLEFESLSELYKKLIENAAANGYAENDVDQLFSVLLTQMKKSEFLSDATAKGTFPEFKTEDSVLSTIDLPIAYLKLTKPSDEKSQTDFQSRLIGIVPGDGSWFEKQQYILSFADSAAFPLEVITETGATDFYNNLLKSGGVVQASSAIDLAATTRELEQFYFNLLMSSDGNLKTILSGINLDSLGVINSIQLVDYLFLQAEAGKINKIDLINLIEKANKQEYNNVLFFKDALADAATGELKLHIQEMHIGYPDNASFNSLIEALLRDSGKGSYKRSEVYDLLIKMIGINDVNQFIDELIKYSGGDIDSLLRTIDRSQFSSPLEVIQYLLSMIDMYDFSESDINNLLIRILLEKGVGVGQDSEKSFYSKFFIERSRFITTLVLANILIIIILILFWRRKKKKQNS